MRGLHRVDGGVGDGGEKVQVFAAQAVEAVGRGVGGGHVGGAAPAGFGEFHEQPSPKRPRHRAALGRLPRRHGARRRTHPSPCPAERQPSYGSCCGPPPNPWAGSPPTTPQHGQIAVAADAVQPQSDDLAAAAPGGDDGLPDVPQAPVVEVEFLQAAQVGLVDQRAGDVVAEGVAGALLEAGATLGIIVCAPAAGTGPERRRAAYGTGRVRTRLCGVRLCVT